MLQNSPFYAYIPARDVARARRFYERHGWAPTGLEANFEVRGTVAPEVEYRKELQ